MRLYTGDNDLPAGQRGYWADAQTFVREHDEIAKNAFRMRFEGDRVVVEGLETAHELGVRFEGALEYS